MKSLALAILVLISAAASGQTTQRASAIHTLIIVGEPGSPMYQRHYQARAQGFVGAANLAELRVGGGSPDTKTVVSGEPAGSGATAKQILAAVANLAAKAQPQDRLILVVLGHGSAGDGGVTLVTPGPDLQIKDLAAAVNAIQCQSQVILNFSASAGDALPLLAAPGRINIAGSSAGQVNDNDFAEFFLQEWTYHSATSVLELYNNAVLMWARWTVRQKMVGEEGKTGWNVEGKESAAIFKKLYDGADVPADRKFVDSPASAKADNPDPPLLPEPKPEWTNRRVITENPSMDDAGSKTPVSALTDKGFAAVTPSVDQPIGKVAAKTVLGTP
jgi:hypothetical protein